MAALDLGRTQVDVVVVVVRGSSHDRANSEAKNLATLRMRVRRTRAGEKRNSYNKEAILEKGSRSLNPLDMHVGWSLGWLAGRWTSYVSKRRQRKRGPRWLTHRIQFPLLLLPPKNLLHHRCLSPRNTECELDYKLRFELKRKEICLFTALRSRSRSQCQSVNFLVLNWMAMPIYSFGQRLFSSFVDSDDVRNKRIPKLELLLFVVEIVSSEFTTNTRSRVSLVGWLSTLGGSRMEAAAAAASHQFEAINWGKKSLELIALSCFEFFPPIPWVILSQDDESSPFFLSARSFPRSLLLKERDEYT